MGEPPGRSRQESSAVRGLAGGAAGALAPCAERMFADLTRQYQFFHWLLEHTGVSRQAARAEAA